MTDRARVIGLIVVEVVLVAVLHALARLDVFSIAWSDLSGWIEETAFEDVFGALVLLVALVLAYWLLLSTLSYLVASLSRRSAALGAVRWLTLPPIRRLVSRAVALSIAASAVAGPLGPAVANLAGDGAAPRVIVEIDESGRLRPPGTGSAETGEEEPPDIIVPPHLQAGPEAEPVEPSPDEPPAVTWDGTIAHSARVTSGDHLWNLSERHLERVLGRSSLDEHEIAPYWVRVIEANRASIRSGNPDLIYPGEVIHLPPVHD